jgi:hypothetical protein
MTPAERAAAVVRLLEPWHLPYGLMLAAGAYATDTANVALVVAGPVLYPVTSEAELNAAMEVESAARLTHPSGHGPTLMVVSLDEETLANA